MQSLYSTCLPFINDRNGHYALLESQAVQTEWKQWKASFRKSSELGFALSSFCNFQTPKIRQSHPLYAVIVQVCIL